MVDIEQLEEFEPYTDEAHMYRGADYMEVSMWFKEPVLLSEAEYTGEYSANPNDYYGLELHEKLKCVALVCNVVVGHWERRIKLKFEPTLHDLINWRDLATEKIDEILDDMHDTADSERYARGFDKLDKCPEVQG